MGKNMGIIPLLSLQHTLHTCPGGEIGRRRGLKIPRRKACRFDSGPGHHKKIKR